MPRALALRLSIPDGAITEMIIRIIAAQIKITKEKGTSLLQMRFGCMG